MDAASWPALSDSAKASANSSSSSESLKSLSDGSASAPAVRSHKKSDLLLIEVLIDWVLVEIRGDIYPKSGSFLIQSWSFFYPKLGLLLYLHFAGASGIIVPCKI
ncbi:uncharacterized protein A4U43_C10F1610 [Asparagus officinalis]|uniref:Uncharacterized protein n=1 Tax=Asparagus officinalis TaxID=4686 RepID=A0A5P1DZU0_ASPOF|nr:uncharacterized protein A4U43_C10F1610 [Asparagus officinalis]